MAEVEQVDRISSLPDALLCEILSFLSTKEAVATSILSKRWKFVWTEVPVINFWVYGCHNPDSVNSFNAFMDRYLVLNDTQSLRLFQLKCTNTSWRTVNTLQYHSWISNIMRRDVVEIDLKLDWGKLPSGTFSNEKLMVLKLTDIDSPLRNPIHLPILLTLHFTRINFSFDFSFTDFLMRLPRLEELIIQDCIGLILCIRSSSLKRLNLVDQVFQEDGINTIQPIVAAPSLEYLCINDFLLSDFKFDNMPSLAEARLHIQVRDYFCEQVFRFLQQVSNLMTLELQVSTKEASLGGDEHDQMPLFPHLKHLVVSGKNCLIKCSNFSWRYLVLRIMQRAPNLISLDCSVRRGYYFNVCSCPLPRVLPTCLPKCPMPTLEVVNISLFELGKADKRLLEYLLNNAVKLKVLTINLKGRARGKTIAAITRLFNVPRASSVCKLVISHQR